MEEIVQEQSKIVLKDIFRFDELLSKPEFQGKWIKARFNKNWEGYDFVERYVNSCPDFIPWILSRGGDKRSRNQVGEIQFQFMKTRNSSGASKTLGNSTIQELKKKDKELFQAHGFIDLNIE